MADRSVSVPSDLARLNAKRIKFFSHGSLITLVPFDIIDEIRQDNTKRVVRFVSDS